MGAGRLLRPPPTALPFEPLSCRHLTSFCACPRHALQVALKLLLDRVMDEDGCRGDSNGPFDEQTVKERREELKRDKVRHQGSMAGAAALPQQQQQADRVARQLPVPPACPGPHSLH